MTALVDLQVACESTDCPSQEQVQQCLDLVFKEQGLDEQEITVRLVEKQESQQLNAEFRGKDKPTNVLSFPFEAPPGIPINLLGDLVICADVVSEEAKQQNKQVLHHWYHMLVHGTLHLLGFDHIEDNDADQMETLEIAILAKLGIDDPYKDH